MLQQTIIKKIAKKILFFAVIILIGGFGGMFCDRYLFPYLSTTKWFSGYDFLKRGAEDITVINKTEQTTVKEEASINQIADQVASSVVSIISYPDPNSKKIALRTDASSNSSSSAKNGTGVIVTGDGMIMTYADAINPTGDKYKVMTNDGNVYDATLLGVDSYSNLAFLKINASNLPVVSFGDSNSVKAGEKVIAMANGFDSYSDRYASGLISDFDPLFNLAGLSVSSSEKLEGVFEADLNYEKYFVGGPVIDYNGQVAGIVGTIERNNVQDFFVIPSNKLKSVINRAIDNELSKNPVLGVYYLPITQTYAIENNLNVQNGALIYSSTGQQGLAIIANSPAQKAGLKIGDIITAVGNDKIVAGQNSLPDLLYGYKQGDSVNLTILRIGQQMQISVQL